MADFSKTPESKNFEDRTAHGLKGFVDAVNQVLQTGRYAKEVREKEAIDDLLLEMTRRAPTYNLVHKRHMENVKANPNIPVDIDLDAMVDYWIHKAKEETTTDRVNLRGQDKR